MASDKRALRTAQAVITTLAVLVIVGAAALSSALLGLGATCANDLDPSECGSVFANVLVPGGASALAGVAAIVACRLSRRASVAWTSGLVLLGLAVLLFPVLFFAW